MLPKADFFNAASMLKRAAIFASDFEVTIQREVGPRSFFFLDPPYAIARRRPFVEYAENSFSRRDLARLIGCLEAIDDAGGRFVLAYDAQLASDFAIRQSWRQHRLTVRRNISGFAGARRNTIEIVTTNFTDVISNA
jgi:DNA adenine methylase